MKYGRLTVIETFTKRQSNGKMATYAKCLCDCGNTKTLKMNDLKTGNTKSCGCLAHDLLVKRNTKHGLRRHPAYNTYISMMNRCYNPKKKSYKHYGVRGITVCKEWHDIHTFCQWCDQNGFKPELQLDRIDNSKGYSPENCRFVTPKSNLRNTRHNVIIGGKVLREYLDELGEKYNIGFPTLRYRYYVLKHEGKEISEESLIHNKRWIKSK